MAQLIIRLLVAVACVSALSPVAPARADCLDTGVGTAYQGGWYRLSQAERSARCLEAEQRAQERTDRRLERESNRQDRQDRRPRGDAASREQECLVNAAACDVSPPK